MGPDSSTIAGAAQAIVQRFGEERILGNREAPVTHALAHIGMQSGFAIVRASRTSAGIDPDALAIELGRRRAPISVTPGDIYTQDGKGYFIVRPLHVDEAP